MSALDLGPVPELAAYARDGLMQGGFLFKVISGKIANVAADEQGIAAIHYLALTAAMVGGLALILMRDLHRPGPILSWLFLLIVTVIGPVTNPTFFKGMKSTTGEEEVITQGIVFTPQAELVSFMSQLHRAIFSALFDYSDPSKPTIRSFEASLSSSNGVNSEATFDRAPAVHHLMQLYKSMSCGNPLKASVPLYDHEYTKDYHTLQSSGYGLSARIPLASELGGKTQLSHQSSYDMQRKTFTLRDVKRFAVESFEQAGGGNSGNYYIPFAVYYMDADQHSGSAPLSFKKAFTEAGVDEAFINTSLEKFYNFTGGAVDSQRHTPEKVNTYIKELSYLTVPYESLYATGSSIFGSDDHIETLTGENGDRSSLLEPIKGAPPYVRFTSAGPQAPSGSAAPTITGSLVTSYKNSIEFGYNFSPALERVGLCVPLVVNSVCNLWNSVRRTAQEISSFMSEEFFERAWEEISDYHAMPVGLAVKARGSRTGWFGSSDHEMFSIVHNCAQLHVLLRHTMIDAALNPEIGSAWPTSDEATIFRSASALESFFGSSSEAFYAKIQSQLDNRDSLGLEPYQVDFYHTARSFADRFGSYQDDGLVHALDDNAVRGAFYQTMANSFIYNAIYGTTRQTKEFPLKAAVGHTKGDSDLDDSVSKMYTSGYMWDNFPVQGWVGGAVGWAADAVSDIIVSLGAMLKPAEAVAYIRWLQLITGLALFLVLLLTPLYYLIGLVIPGQAMGVVINSLLVVVVLKTIPITYTIVNFAFSYIMLSFDAYSLLKGDLELMIYVMAGAYTSIAAITLFILFKAGDSQALMSQVGNIDGAAKEIANTAIDVVQKAGLAIAGGASLGAYGGWKAVTSSKKDGGSGDMGVALTGAMQQVGEAAGSLPFVGRFAQEMTNAGRQGAAYGEMDARARKQAGANIEKAEGKIKAAEEVLAGGKNAQGEPLSGEDRDRLGNEIKANQQRIDEYRKMQEGGASYVMRAQKNIKDAGIYTGALEAVEADIRDEAIAKQWFGTDAYQARQGKADDSANTAYRKAKADDKIFDAYIAMRAEELEGTGLAPEEAKRIAKSNYDEIRYGTDKLSAMTGLSKNAALGESVGIQDMSRMLRAEAVNAKRRENRYSFGALQNAAIDSRKKSIKAKKQAGLTGAYDKAMAKEGSTVTLENGLTVPLTGDAHNEITADLYDLNHIVREYGNKKYKTKANNTIAHKAAEEAITDLHIDIASGQFKFKSEDIPQEISKIMDKGKEPGSFLKKINAGHLGAVKELQVPRYHKNFKEIEKVILKKYPQMEIAGDKPGYTLDAVFIKMMEEKAKENNTTSRFEPYKQKAFEYSDQDHQNSMSNAEIKLS